MPEIRFYGFEDFWEETKLGQISEIKTGPFGSTLHAEDYVENGIPIITTEHFKKGSLPILKDGTPQVSESDYIRLKSYILLDGDLVFSRVGSVDINALVTSFQEGWLFSGRVLRVRPQKKYNSDFLHSLLDTTAVKNHVLSRAVGQTMPSINTEILKETELNLTSNFIEQQKIGAFFKQLDDTIALQQRQLERLKDSKQGFLQKMFPKDGESVPEVRFSGFVEDWDECKLGEHANFRRGSFPQPYGNKEWYDGEGAMPFVQVVDVTDHLVLVDNTKQKISKLAQPKSVFVPEGKVVVTLQGSIGRVAITQYNSFVDRTILIFENFEKKTDEHFWAYTIQKKFNIEKRKAPGGTIKTITKEALSSFEIGLPEYKEQQKIGKFFKQLDETIALHEKELDLLKETKKAFLQKMFV
ncbi:restriction endonuclease subunit S [Oceanobacillus picturae]|uniref:restriction endonuclease subunit S n=1 Tax=Oceanobacillus picturae TaxID=171693 RepID=UPI0036351A33